MQEIMTVRGPIPPETLGLTSMHEHIVYDGSIYRQRWMKELPPEDLPSLFFSKTKSPAGQT